MKKLNRDIVEEKDSEVSADNQLFFDTVIDGFLYQLNIITGCPLPEGEDDDDELMIKRQIQSFLCDTPPYATLTIQDILLAFQMNAAGRFPEKVKHFGLFSLDYLGDVLSQYIVLKAQVERKIEQAAIKYAPEITYDKKDEEQLTRQIITDHYSAFIAGTLSIDFIQPFEYQYLDSLNLLQLSVRDKNNLMATATERRLATLTAGIKSPRDAKAIGELANGFRKNIAPASEHAMIVAEAQRLAVYDLFRDLSSLGVKSVFDVTGINFKKKNVQKKETEKQQIQQRA